MMSLCAINVTAASTSKLATVTHNGYATDTRSQQQTHLAIKLANKNGDEISTTNVNQTVQLLGLLRMPGTSNYIGGATVNIQLSLDGNTWTTILHTTTETGKYNGFFFASWTPQSTGVVYVRATYDGDSQYAPTVSNVVQVTVN
jgi:hypothetical protein